MSRWPFAEPVPTKSTLSEALWPKWGDSVPLEGRTRLGVRVRL
jgi:hypothetical protein